MLDRDGIYTIEYRSVDRAGNVEETKRLPLNLDDTAPQTAGALNPTDPSGKNGWYAKPVTIILTGSDATSGIAKTEYRIINADSTSEWKEYTGSFVVSEDGNYKVEYRSVDKAGNVEETHAISFKLDQTAPTLKVTLDKTVLWPPNHKYVPITATVEVEDELADVESIVLTSITSNEPDDSEGDGNHINDIIDATYGTLDTTFQVRAERSGTGTGRIYTVTYTAIDAAGNETVVTATISVPHDQSKP